MKSRKKLVTMLSLLLTALAILDIYGLTVVGYALTAASDVSVFLGIWMIVFGALFNWYCLYEANKLYKTILTTKTKTK